MFIILNLCIYYFKFMYLIYALFYLNCVIIFELMYLLFLIHVFIIFEYMYLLFLTIKLFLCFYLLLFQDMSFTIIDFMT